MHVCIYINITQNLKGIYRKYVGVFFIRHMHYMYRSPMIFVSSRCRTSHIGTFASSTSSSPHWPGVTGAVPLLDTDSRKNQSNLRRRDPNRRYGCCMFSDRCFCCQIISSFAVNWGDAVENGFTPALKQPKRTYVSTSALAKNAGTLFADLLFAI